MSDHKCYVCGRPTLNNGYRCSGCASDQGKRTNGTLFEDEASTVKVIMSDRERLRRAHASSGAKAHVSNAATQARKHEAAIQERAELLDYVTVEQRVVTAREAIIELVRAGGKRADIMRAVNDGIQSASQPEDAYFTGTRAHRS
jgi:hypothetical protein